MNTEPIKAWTKQISTLKSIFPLKLAFDAMMFFSKQYTNINYFSQYTSDIKKKSLNASQ